MSTLLEYAKQELNILATRVPNAIVNDFAKPILYLCSELDKSRQSDVTKPDVASAIVNIVRKLLSYQPITDITGDKDEWSDLIVDVFPPYYQNKRCTALFKEWDGRCIYSRAIIFRYDKTFSSTYYNATLQGAEFVGSVYTDNSYTELVTTTQYVKKFPFQPKTFYIDVVNVPIPKHQAEKRNLSYDEDEQGFCYMQVVKDPEQLEKVFEYYDKRIIIPNHLSSADY